METVRQLSENCIEWLYTCRSYTQDEKSRAAIHNRLADFYLWCDGVGARAGSRASLDKRFESRPDDLVMIKGMLNLLHQFLENYAHLLRNAPNTVSPGYSTRFSADNSFSQYLKQRQPDPHAEDTTESLHNTPQASIIDDRYQASEFFNNVTASEADTNKARSDYFDEALHNIDSALGNLALLAMAIRQTGKKARLEKADRKYDPDDYPLLRDHLEFILRIHRDPTKSDPTHDDPVGCKSKCLDWRQYRLVDANLRRRNRFIQAQQHYMHLKSKPTTQTTTRSCQREPEDISQNTQNEPTSHPAHQKHKFPIAKSPNSQVYTVSGTSASVPDSKMNLDFRQIKRPSPVIEGPRTAITKINASTGYPRVKVPPGQHSFQCPCCCQTLTEEYAIDDDLWRKHLANDISPYTCIAEKCPSPFNLYTTTADLEYHLRHDHPQTWQCPLCDQSPLAFAREEFLEFHIRMKHMEVGPEEWPGLLSMSLQYGLGIKVCPLCGEYDDIIDSPELITHVLEHMHSFSILSLPWMNETSDANIEKDSWFNPSYPSLLLKPRDTKRINLFTSSEPLAVIDRLMPWLESDAVPTAYDVTNTQQSLWKVKHEPVDNSPDFFSNHLYFVDQSTNASASTQQELEEHTPKELLIARLRQAFVTNPGDNRRFIPRQQLEKICDEQAVAQELSRAFPDHDRSLCQSRASLICHGQTQDTSITSQPCFKIFVILVLISKTSLIESFLQNQLCDKDLPLFGTPDLALMYSHQNDPTTSLSFPNEDDPDLIIEAFLDRQWSVLAPSFDAPEAEHMRYNVYEFHDKTILPIQDISKHKYLGGFGLVEKVKIHSEHHGFNHEYFALKTMHPMMPNERDRFFQQELYAFQMVKPGGHIIEICAAFKRGDSRCFLFPWAKGGNLNTLWTKPPQDIIQSAGVQWSQFSRWICIQCHGIIRDLRAIHEPSDIRPGNSAEALFGIHSDIKPDNILYFTQDGLPLGSLKISDLGLMKFHREVSRTMKSSSMSTAYQTYRSPEHDLGNFRSRKIDIWAFGCLFAEFLTWAIRGYNGVEVFKTRRMEDDRGNHNEDEGEWVEDNFFILKSFPLPPHYKKPKRKGSIKVWFTELINELGHNMDDTFFPEFLNYIQKHMLQPDRGRRADCKQVEAFLERLKGKPVESPYWRFNGTVSYENDDDEGMAESGTMW